MTNITLKIFNGLKGWWLDVVPLVGLFPEAFTFQALLQRELERKAKKKKKKKRPEPKSSKPAKTGRKKVVESESEPEPEPEAEPDHEPEPEADDDENDAASIDFELDDEGNPKVFCLCRKPERPNMIGCDFCDEWYHYNCLNLTRAEARELTKKEWTCPNCESKKKSGKPCESWNYCGF